MGRNPLPVLLSLVMLVAACAHSRPPTLNRSAFLERSFENQGKKRTYYVFLPSKEKEKQKPLLIAFHGGHGDALGFEQISGLSKVAEEKGFILVYPEGLEKHWNDGRPEVTSGVDDVAFVDVLLERLAQEFKIDSKSVYATGFSNGGLFSYRLACDRPEKFAAVAAVGANMGENLSKVCHPKHATSVLQIIGVKDPLMHFKGGNITGPFGRGNIGRSLSSNDTVAFWTSQNHCPKKPSLDKQAPDDGPKIDQEAFSPCAENTAVERYTILDGGHTWPGGWQYLGEWLIGKTTHALNASETVWDFLSKHQR